MSIRSSPDIPWPGAWLASSLELIMRDDVGDLVADGFDLAVRVGQPPGGSLIARKLIDMRVLTVASPDYICLLYTSDAADDLPCVGLGGRRINKKNKAGSSPSHHASSDPPSRSTQLPPPPP